jgi:hypothetical protein
MLVNEKREARLRQLFESYQLKLNRIAAGLAVLQQTQEN